VAGVSLFLGIIVLSCDSKPKQVEGDIPQYVSATLPVERFQQKLDSAKNAVVLDVRTPEELEGGYIKGAINIDFNAKGFREKMERLDRDATYFVYCASGKRSRKAADMMEGMGFKRVYDLEGGFTDWDSKGLPSLRPPH